MSARDKYHFRIATGLELLARPYFHLPAIFEIRGSAFPDWDF
jgi:hypothetical protein